MTIALSSCVSNPASDLKDSQTGSNRFEGRSVNILMSFGGAANYYYPVIMKLQESYPGLTVNFSYASDADEVFRIKVLSNNIPDIFNLNSSKFDYFNAIEQGICMPLEPILDMEIKDGLKLIDYLDRDLLQSGYHNGHPYLFGEVMFLSGLWYNKALLDTYGILPPETWQEMLDACKKLKQNGIYGFGYCGQAAREYALAYWFTPMLCSESKEAYDALEKLNPSVWESNAVRKVLGKMEQLRDLGYSHPLSPNLSNAEAQAMFINGDFAFLPCGSWLENEMAGAWPENFKLSYLPFSGKDSAAGKDYTSATALTSAVSADTQNLDIVKEFYRIMYTDSDTVEAQMNIHKNTIILKDFDSSLYRNFMNASTAQIWDAVDHGLSIIEPMAFNIYPDYAVKAGEDINLLMKGAIKSDKFSEDLKHLFESLPINSAK